MILLKQGVRLRGLTPEMSAGVTVVASVYHSFQQNCVITSVNDSKHGRGSLHFCGNAVDFRTKNLPEGMKTKLAADVRMALGADFDVILESLREDNEHLHVEWQPKVL